eukprot:3997418-Alexandrium_andersonii.AAC.1
MGGSYWAPAETSRSRDPLANVRYSAPSPARGDRNTSTPNGPNGLSPRLEIGRMSETPLLSVPGAAALRTAPRAPSTEARWPP